MQILTEFFAIIQSLQRVLAHLREGTRTFAADDKTKNQTTY